MTENTNIRNEDNGRNWLGVGLLVLLIIAVGAALIFLIFNRPEPATVAQPVDTAALAQEVAALMPTPASAAAPVEIDLEEVRNSAKEGAQEAIDAFVESQATPEGATITSTVPMTNTVPMTETVDVEEEGEADTATPEATAETDTEVITGTNGIEESPVLTPTYELVLDEYFTAPINFAGGPPIALAPNGDWFADNTANDSWASVAETWKDASEGCEMPAACNVYSPSGVLGADDYNEAVANESAVWTGSMWHDSPDNADSEYSMLCPEGSYCDSYALQFGRVEIGPRGNPYIVLEIPSCGEHCGQGLLIRNWLSRPEVDLNTTVVVSDYGEPGASSWTEYVVPIEWAEYFSGDYATAQAENAHNFNNNGSGPDDNELFIQHVFDLNDMSYTILGHTAQEKWFVIWSNVESYGVH